MQSIYKTQQNQLQIKASQKSVGGRSLSLQAHTAVSQHDEWIHKQITNKKPFQYYTKNY